MKRMVCVLIGVLLGSCLPCVFAGDDASAKAIDIGGGVKMEFVAIPGGTFLMGSPATEPHRLPNEGPRHQVTISPFEMMTTEVTEEQYQTVMGDNPSVFRHGASGKQPVNSVSWWDAVRFCNALSLKLGLKACYTNITKSATLADGDEVSCDWQAEGFRLPTESEWEYACRGGKDTAYFWGSTFDGQWVVSQENSQVGYPVDYKAKAFERVDISGHGPFDVESKFPNEYGLYDMSGNLWEWCWDWFGEYPATPQHDPRGPAEGDRRAFRGGCFASPVDAARSAKRNGPGCSVTGRWFAMGFRLVRKPGPEDLRVD